MPTFCRHNRLVQNCPICSREQSLQMRPVVSPGGQTVRPERTGRERAGASTPARSRPAGPRRAGGRSGHGVVIRRLCRGVDDGYRSPLVPGLRSSADAERLTDELAFAATRLRLLAADPPGLYAEVAAAEQSREERTWLAFLIAYVAPTEDDAPFHGIERARTSWQPWAAPSLHDVTLGPRTAHDRSRGMSTVDAYRGWAQRAGGQAAAFGAEPSWTAERRFARLFERLALPGMHRGARFELLASLGRLGCYDLRAGALGLGGNDPVTLAAKRLLGIGDPLLLERRALELAAACELPLEALDLGLHNWEQGTRAGVGVDPSSPSDPAVLPSITAALGLQP